MKHRPGIIPAKNIKAEYASSQPDSSESDSRELTLALNRSTMIVGSSWKKIPLDSMPPSFPSPPKKQRAWTLHSDFSWK
jgi:hypothetical protein